MSKATTYPASARGPADHDIRDQIVAAATDHFRLYGYEKTTVSDLAKAIGFSKAYIYKFFESKRAIGEVICANCLSEIEAAVREGIRTHARAPEKLRSMFTVMPQMSLQLAFQDRKLYDLAAAAAQERWQAVTAFEACINQVLQGILREGREAGDFEDRTPLEETANTIYLLMRPYCNPLLLQYNLDSAEYAPAQFADLVLRSLAR